MILSRVSLRRVYYATAQFYIVSASFCRSPACTSQSAMSETRQVVKSMVSVWQSEGQGAKVRRSIGRHEMNNLDPFLLLDEFEGQQPAGFPDHPHRGFETVSYLLDGQFRHEDFAGNEGILSAGDLQWMTAGRGIVHCEMPWGTRPSHGLQLWVNLSRKDKMVEPAYQELKDANIPKKKQDGVWVKVIAGESMGIKSPVYTRTPTMYLHFRLDPGAAEAAQAVPAGWTAFVYVLAGTPQFGRTVSEPHSTLLFGDGDHVTFSNPGQTEADFVFIAGQPLREPVVQHGPFVMTSQEEIAQAIDDYRRGRNGFEKAPGFRSFATQGR